MAKPVGMECPWCHQIPFEGFPVKKKINLRLKIERWHVCPNPKCGRSFKSVQVSVAEPYLKKEFPGEIVSA
jgi:hypothetical protein